MADIPKRLPSEELLVSNGVAKLRSEQRRAALGCIGCQWLKPADSSKPAGAYGYKIARCQDLSRVTAYAILGQLEAAGVVQKEREAVNPEADNLPQRSLYYPSDSPLGQAFLETLEIPTDCPEETIQ